MVLRTIEKLLKKYKKGETTLDEEQVLKNYFNGNNIAPHLQNVAPRFRCFLDDQQEHATKPVLLNTNRRFHYKWLVGAAVTLFMLGFYFKTPDMKLYNTYVYGTYNEPEQAFYEVSKTLAMISGHFNKGAATVNYLKQMEKGTATLGYLNEVENTTHIIFKKY